MVLTLKKSERKSSEERSMLENSQDGGYEKERW